MRVARSGESECRAATTIDLLVAKSRSPDQVSALEEEGQSSVSGRLLPLPHRATSKQQRSLDRPKRVESVP